MASSSESSAGSSARDVTDSSKTLGPVVGNQRVVFLDALRGFAIFGILLVNIELFYGPDFYLLQAGEQVLSGIDLVLGFLISFFFQAKFYSIFSFLFGLGLVMQTMRAEEKGRSSGRFLSRRLGVLALFGLIHAVLIWSGDILLTYALLGFVFLLFRRRRARTLLIWAGIFLFAPPLLLLLAGLGALLATSSPEGAQAIAQAGVSQAESIRGIADSAQAAYTSGSYLEMVAQRLSEGLYMLSGLFFIGPSIFGMFLVGGAVVRAGWLRDLDAHRVGIRRVILVGLLVGLPLNLVAALALTMNPGGAAGTALIWVGQSCQLLGAPLLALAYAGIAFHIFRRFSDSTLSRRISAVGRSAFTNYLMQSVICTAIFYGLGLYGQVGLLPALILCLLIYAFQLFVSPLWLSRFRYGPMEWLWRTLTYGSFGNENGSTGEQSPTR